MATAGRFSEESSKGDRHAMNRYVTAVALWMLYACSDAASKDAGGTSNTAADAGASKAGAKGGLDPGAQGGPGATADAGLGDDGAIDAATDAVTGPGTQPRPDAGASASTYPLALSASKEYLVDANGKPWFMQGDTAWSL